MNYSTIELELLAIVWSTKYFRPYLYGRKFTILSDHKPLQWLFNINDPGSRLLRWRLKLAEYDYQITHISGTQNTVADTLSRIHVLQRIDNVHPMDTISEKQAKTIVQFTTTEESNLQVNEIQQEGKEILCCYKQRNNENFILKDFSALLTTLKNFCEKRKLTELGILDDVDSGTQNEYQKQRTERILQRFLYPLKLHWIESKKLPPNKEKFLHKIHTHPLALHPGINRMHAQLKQNGYQWPGMKTDIANLVNRCEECQLIKINRQRNKIPLLITDTSTEPFQKISLDFIGPLPLTIYGNQYALTIQDDLTKFLLVKSSPTMDTATVAKKLIKIFSLFGISSAIRTNQGSAFCSNLIKELTSTLGIKKIECSPYHPESNGGLERAHSSFKETLKFQITTDRNNWDDFVDLSIYAYNTAIHSSTGYSPFELLFGRKPYLLYLQQDSTKTYTDYHTETR